MARNGILDAQYAPGRNDGKWRVCRFTHLHNLDIAWTWTVGGQTWLLLGQVADNEAVYQTLAPRCGKYAIRCAYRARPVRSRQPAQFSRLLVAAPRYLPGRSSSGWL